MAAIQVIGFGPAALGVGLAADRLGVLDQLGRAGVLFLDGARAADVLRAGRLRYSIKSNSRADDFLSGIDPNGHFGPLLELPTARELHALGSEAAPLRLVGAFLADLADGVAAWCHSGPGAVRYGCQVATVQHNGRYYASYDRMGNLLAQSRAVILATGVRENLGRCGAILSGDVLSGKAKLGPCRHVVVLGGSHSGFAVAHLLLQQQNVEHVTVVYRKLRVCFSSAAEMGSVDGALFASHTVCEETGRINRFSGLRGQARELCLAILGGIESRASLQMEGSPSARVAIERADHIVTATGYSASVPEVYYGNRAISFVREDGLCSVDRRGRVIDYGGSELKDIYGLGMGFARLHHTGERRASLNIFYGDDAPSILRDIVPASIDTIPEPSAG